MDLSIIVTIVISTVGALVSWLAADVRSKARLSFLEERIGLIRHELDVLEKVALDKIATNEIRLARFSEHKDELNRQVNRLDDQKASKDVVDGFRVEVTNMRFDMDKRFDRIERLFQETKQGYNN